MKAQHWNQRQRQRVARVFANARRGGLSAVMVAIAVAALGVGLAESASTNTALPPGTSTNITQCTTSLSLSATKSPAKLACAKVVTPPTTTTTVPPTTTTITTTPVGGTCTTPVATLTSGEDTYNTDPSDGYQYYWVNADEWSGDGAPQVMAVCNQSSWTVTTTQPNNGGQVETYPDTEYDVGGRDNPSTTPISGFSGGSINSTFAEAYPTAGGWDAGYDLWTNNWTNETMVWNQWAGGQAYWANCANAANPESYCGVPQNAAVTIGGVSYHFLANGPANTDCTTANEGNCELMFFRDSQVSSGSVNLLAVFQWEVANGYAKSSDIPTQLEYGVEVSYTSGSETFPLTGLTFSLTS